MDDAGPELVADAFAIGDIFWRKTGPGVETLIGSMDMTIPRKPLQLESNPPTSILEGPFSELTPASAHAGGRLDEITFDTEYWTLPAFRFDSR